MSLDDELFEKRAFSLIKKLTKKHGKELAYIWRLYDGNGALFIREFEKHLNEMGFMNTLEYKEEIRQQREIEKLGNVDKKLREYILDRDNKTCVYCGSQNNLTIDHIHPRALGGLSEISNLQTLCRSCNSKKGKNLNFKKAG